jgi:hypothetical protein
VNNFQKSNIAKLGMSIQDSSLKDSQAIQGNETEAAKIDQKLEDCIVQVLRARKPGATC